MNERFPKSFKKRRKPFPPILYCFIIVWGRIRDFSRQPPALIKKMRWKKNNLALNRTSVRYSTAIFLLFLHFTLLFTRKMSFSFWSTLLNGDTSVNVKKISCYLLSRCLLKFFFNFCFPFFLISF